MPHFTVDLYQSLFWVALGAAIVLLVPLTHAATRKFVLAFVNLGFLVALMGISNVTCVLGGVLIITAATLQVQNRPRHRRIVIAVASLAILSLFLVHKRPDWASAVHLHYLSPLLAAIGFSYVALRLWDMLRHVAEGSPAPDLAAAINYLLPFHMLAAGPIQSYGDFVEQPHVPPRLNLAAVLYAVERIARGMFKKYVLAHFIESVFLTDFRAPLPYLLFEVQFFYVWVYLDFSAYSDIAVGVGRLIGVHTPENFNVPFIARNLIDFWERWHMSLSLFIRRNIFIPLQLLLARRSARTPLFCASMAFTVSFLLCGFWHAIELRWIIWGAMHAVALVVANLYRAGLTRRLGREGVKSYLDNPWIRWMAIVLTQEYVAVSLMITLYPFKI